MKTRGSDLEGIGPTGTDPGLGGDPQPEPQIQAHEVRPRQGIARRAHGGRAGQPRKHPVRDAHHHVEEKADGQEMDVDGDDRVRPRTKIERPPQLDESACPHAQQQRDQGETNERPVKKQHSRERRKACAGLTASERPAAQLLLEIFAVARGEEGVVSRSLRAVVLLVVALPVAFMDAAAAGSPPTPPKVAALRLPPGIVFKKAPDAPAPVVFDHVAHVRLEGNRCLACHPQPFKMLRPSREATHAAMDAGGSCGSCHDGKKAFATVDTERCDVCHRSEQAPK